MAVESRRVCRELTGKALSRSLASPITSSGGKKKRKKNQRISQKGIFEMEAVTDCTEPCKYIFKYYTAFVVQSIDGQLHLYKLRFP